MYNNVKSYKSWYKYNTILSQTSLHVHVKQVWLYNVLPYTNSQISARVLSNFRFSLLKTTSRPLNQLYFYQKKLFWQEIWSNSVFSYFIHYFIKFHDSMARLFEGGHLSEGGGGGGDSYSMIYGNVPFLFICHFPDKTRYHDHESFSGTV